LTLFPSSSFTQPQSIFLHLLFVNNRTLDIPTFVFPAKPWMELVPGQVGCTDDLEAMLRAVVSAPMKGDMKGFCA
jgi:hypothetical protein